MGMASSQARLLSITARMNDVEFKSQSIANTKIRLADESEAVSKAYTEALGKTQLMYTSWASGQAQTIKLNATNLSTYGYRLVNANGDPVTVSNDDSYDLYEMIESGEFFLQKDSAYTTINYVPSGIDSDNWGDVSVSGDNQLALGSVDNVDLAKAEADYNAATARINRKEKLLDNELKALDTEHNALKTEQDAIKQLVGNNVEKTFNIFS